MLHGLMKDSAVIGTYKRMSRKPRYRKSTTNELAWFYDLFIDENGLFGGRRARRDYAKARAEFYKTHGYYLDDSTR